MRSGTSFFDWTVCRKTLLRFWPVWTAYSVIWLVALPLNGLMRLQMDARDPAWNSGYVAGFARDVVPGMHDFSLAMAVFFGALAAMAVCSHLYNAKSANFFGSLPIRREGMFLTHYLAGLAFLIVPNAAVFLLTLAVEAAGGAVYLPELLFWLGVTCGECLFFYSMAVFCGMFTGHILALPAFYAIFNALAAVLCLLLEWVFDSFYYGFAGFEQWVSDFVMWLTPVWHLGRGVGLYRSTHIAGGGSITDTTVKIGLEGMDIVAAYAVVGVLLAVGAFFLYRARRMESAGDVVSVKCMRPVFKYSVSVCAGLCFGMLTAQVVYMHEPGLMASILVWAVAGYFVAQMLLDKSFRVFGKWKGAAAVAGAFILMYLVVGFDLTGYETRVPTVDQVDYVDFSCSGVVRLGDQGDYLEVLDGSDAGFIELVILLHQEAVDTRDHYVNDIEPGGAEGLNMNVTYHLKNGSTLTRKYYPWIYFQQADQEGTAAWAVQQMYNNRELYWKDYGFEEAERRMAQEDYRLEQVWFANDDHAPDVDQTLYYYGRDAQALYEAVKEDFQANRIGVRRIESGAAASWPNKERTLNFHFVNSQDSTWWVEIYVQDTASSTLAVLERLAEESTGEYRETDPETAEAVPTAEPYPNA